MLFSALNENFTVKVRHRNITTGPNIKQQIIVLIDGSITPRLLNNDIILIENKAQIKLAIVIIKPGIKVTSILFLIKSLVSIGQ